MWPIGHAAVAYLIFSLYNRIRNRSDPSEATAAIVAVASQGPDLVDKPLAWRLGVLASGRSLSHSLFVLAPVAWGGYALARRIGRPDIGRALVVGTLTHTLVDALPAVCGKADARFLAWPLTRVPVGKSGHPTISGLLRRSLRDPEFYAEFLLAGLAALAWWRDGAPGVERLTEHRCARNIETTWLDRERHE